MNIKELHDAVKVHPYREGFGEQYIENYRKLLYEFSSQFWKDFKTSKQAKHTKFAPFNFDHDFNTAIRYLPEQWAILHTELCISTIHEFIDTGMIITYFTHYKGTNTLKSLPRQRKYVWDNHRKGWFIQLTEDELKGSIQEIEEYQSRKGKLNEFGIYTEEQYQYLKERLEDFYKGRRLQ